MFGKKNKNRLVPHIEKEEPEKFVIPEIVDENLGLRVSRPGFQKTPSLSPMEGRYVKDIQVVPEIKNHQDVDLAYDAFRVEKRLTEQDEIERYGQKYHEFTSVDEKLDISKYQTSEQIAKPEKKDFGIDFDFMIDSNNLPKNERHESVREEATNVAKNPTIHFGENNSYKKEEPVIFNELNINDELKAEIEPPFVGKPITKVPDFINLKNTSMSNEEEVDIPKTIITRTPKKIQEEVNIPFEKDPIVNKVPSFVNTDIKTERVFEAPSFTKEQPINPYDAVKNEATSSKIYIDKYEDYIYPPYSLLDEASKASAEIPDWVEEKKEALNQCLSEFGVDGSVVGYTYGPSVTRYEVKLSSGVNVRKVTGIEDNIKMELAAKTVRIEAPIPGKSNVGIEIPNLKVRSVSFSEIVDRDEFKNSDKPLRVGLGLAIDGNPVYTDIAKMPHGIIAGGTGSGKSVCTNTLLVSLLMKNSPNDLKLILVDPPQVELINYQDIPHLATPVITDVKMASEALRWACDGMGKRYTAFTSVRAKDIAGYNTRIKNDPSMKKMPYLVIMIDELADLMLQCGKDVEDSIQRITQMGRAAGIHMLIATQRPTTDVVKGTIKNNIPTRIAFRVSQAVDSMTILDQPGAESLLGNGDMLFRAVELPIRIQGAYISDDEIMRVCDFIRAHYKEDYIFTHEELQGKMKESYGANGNKSDGEDPELLYEIASNVVSRGICSINNIQNTYNLGFNRAQRIVELLEEMGIVSEKRGTTGREILVTLDDINQMFRKGE